MGCAKCQMSCYNGSEKEDTVLGWNNLRELRGAENMGCVWKMDRTMKAEKRRSSQAHSGEWGMLECG